MRYASMVMSIICLAAASSIAAVASSAPNSRTAAVAKPQMVLAAHRCGPGWHWATVQAVVRYNVTSTDGLFNTGFFAYRLRLRCRGQISAKLIEVDLASGIEKARIQFNSDNHTAFEDQVAFESAGDPPRSVPFDFGKKAYYVEATLTASAVAIGHPAAISIIQISAASTII